MIIIDITAAKATITTETIVTTVKHITVIITLNHMMDDAVFHFILFFCFFFFFPFFSFLFFPFCFFSFFLLCKDDTRLYLITVNDTITDIVCILKGIDDTIGKLLCDMIIPERLGREVLKASDKDTNNKNSKENKAKETSHIAYLIVPSFAMEMMKNEPLAVTKASYNIETSQLTHKYLNHTHFCTYVRDGAMVVQLGGALKKLLAIHAGIAAGLGNDQSTIAAMITRGVCGGTIYNGK